MMNASIRPALQQFTSALKSLNAARYPCALNRKIGSFRVFEYLENASQMKHRRSTSVQSRSQTPHSPHNTAMPKVKTT